jgi:hypothetical protein
MPRNLHEIESLISLITVDYTVKRVHQKTEFTLLNKCSI